MWAVPSDTGGLPSVGLAKLTDARCSRTLRLLIPRDAKSEFGTENQADAVRAEIIAFLARRCGLVFAT